MKIAFSLQNVTDETPTNLINYERCSETFRTP